MPDGGRLLDFWGTGTWMPLLAALRRLEAASSHGGPGGGSRSCLHPQLADLKKTAGSIAALLLRDCMPDPPEADAPDNSAGVSIFLFFYSSCSVTASWILRRLMHRCLCRNRGGHADNARRISRAHLKIIFNFSGNACIDVISALRYVAYFNQ